MSDSNPFEIINSRFDNLENLVNKLLKNQQIVKDINPDEDVIFNVEQAADFIKLSPPSIYRLTGLGELPFIKKGRKLLFSKKSLTTWLMDGKNQTLSQIQKRAEITE